jgi:predicted DNA-binding transcriptional regulator AlpA
MIGMTTTTIEPQLLSIPDGATALGISRSGLYRLERAGLIRTVHVGSRHLVPASEITRYINSLLADRRRRAAAEQDLDHLADELAAGNG